MQTTQENYIKVHISLTNHWMVGGESMFAIQLESGHYRIENIPFFCYGLNLHDIVSATVDKDGSLEVDNLIEKSGNSTIRMFFNEKFTDDKIVEYLAILKNKGCSAERGNFNLFALNVPEESNFNELVNTLNDWEIKDILSFETGESRMKDSFDDIPQSDD